MNSSPLSVILETGGIGYLIYIPANVFGKLPQCGEKILLHTSYVIREQSQALYGFLSLQEKDLFETLLGVSGIGPKTALSLIGHLPLHDLQRAIGSHDITALCKVPGIGKKTAERLIIELRDKLNALSISPGDVTVQAPSDPKAITIRDAMSALINLGYNQTTAQKAIKKTIKDKSDDIDLATLITDSLKNI